MRAGKAAASIKALAAQGAQVKELEDRKSIRGFEWLFEGFLMLTGDRVATFGGLGRIPWTAVDQYARSQRMTSAETWVFTEVMRHLDNIMLEWANDKTSRKKNR